MNYDSRDVPRGTCTEYGCACIGYDGGLEKKKCVRCFHPPGKHRNLSNLGSVGSTSTATGHYMGSHTTPHNMGGGFQSNPVTVSHRYNTESVQLHQPSHFHHHHPHHEPRPQSQLPQCQANGCFNPVHCDPSLPEGLRAFAYCSPECRDRHLLPMERVNLKVDLDDMKKKLQEVAAAEKRSPSSVLQRQSSYEHSSRPAGSSSFTGAGHVLGGPSGVYSSSTPGRSSSGVTSSSSILAGASHHTSGVNGSSVTPGGGDQHSSRNSTLSASTGGGHVLDTSGKQAKEQRTSMVITIKKNHEQFGVLLCKKPYYTSDKTYKFMIIGVRRGSPAYSKMLEGKIKVFDVIERVNDNTCSDLHIPGIDPQQSFDQNLNKPAVVTLHLSHSLSLPSTSKLLDKAQRLEYTHVIALRYSPSCTERAYGLTLSSRIPDKVLVGGRTVDTPANDSGIEYGDEIRMYAFASEDGIDDGEMGTKLDEDKLDEAQHAKKSVVLLIWRSRGTVL